MMEQEAAGTGQTRVDFAFSLCLEPGCSFGNSPGAFSFGALEWQIKAARASPGARQGQEEQPLAQEGAEPLSSPALGWDIARLCPASPAPPAPLPGFPAGHCTWQRVQAPPRSCVNPGQPHQLRSRLQFCL